MANRTLGWDYRLLGANPKDEAARWLLEFRDQDLSALVHKKLAGKIHRFMFAGMLRDVVFTTNEQSREDNIAMLSGWGPPEKVIPIKEIPRMQTALREGLDRLFRGEPWACDIPHAREVLLLDSANRVILHRPVETDYLTLFVAQAMHTLMAVSPRLRRCEDPACRRLFLATRRQKFCNYRHGAKIRMARLRADNREKMNKQRREAYKRKMQKIHPKVKIASRRRKNSTA